MLFLSALVCWPIGWLVARRKGSAATPRLAGLARWLAWGISALYVLFLILFVVSISDLALFPSLLTKAALAIALVATVLTSAWSPVRGWPGNGAIGAWSGGCTTPC